MKKKDTLLIVTPGHVSENTQGTLVIACVFFYRAQEKEELDCERDSCHCFSFD